MHIDSGEKCLLQLIFSFLQGEEELDLAEDIHVYICLWTQGKWFVTMENQGERERERERERGGCSANLIKDGFVRMRYVK